MSKTTTRMHALNLYRRYFDLVVTGRKTIEVRVRYPHLADMAAGDRIRFRIKGTEETCDVRVLRVAAYDSFEELLDGEGPANVNPMSSREQQLANIRAIYPPEKEQLGALAIEVALIGGGASDG
ncbi:ASCH domain-containing protein [Streptomyces sp. NPDC059466]|uniref:ASCH domain-containing protein n=1 Tax=unclassified Streptomyces TaxID=2593676 RepID=UPI0036C77BC0